MIAVMLYDSSYAVCMITSSQAMTNRVAHTTNIMNHDLIIGVT